MKTPPSLVPRQKASKACGLRSARQFPWTKEEDALLGKFTDREVAGKLNRTLGAVRDRRKFLGKPAVGHAPQPFRMEREPRDRYARLFATKSNRELRALLGWNYKRIHTRRRQLAGGKVRKLQPEWTLEEDRLLGTKPDHVLARKFGRTIKAVEARRIQLAFKVIKVVAEPVRRRDSAVTPNAKPGARYCTWTAEEDALLGKLAEEEKSIPAEPARKAETEPEPPIAARGISPRLERATRDAGYTRRLGKIAANDADRPRDQLSPFVVLAVINPHSQLILYRSTSASWKPAPLSNCRHSRARYALKCAGL